MINERLRLAAIALMHRSQVVETTGMGMMAPAPARGFKVVRPLLYSSPDEKDGHVHECIVDERGTGTTGVGGSFPHWHQVSEHRVRDYFIDAGGVAWTSSHKGTLEGRES